MRIRAHGHFDNYSRLGQNRVENFAYPELRLIIFCCGACSMENYLFTPRNLAVLQDVGRWRFVAAGLPVEVPPARRCAHDAWAHRYPEAHFHRELLIILSGRGFYGFCGKTYPTRPGTVFLFDTMNPHDRGYPLAHASAEHLWFHFSQEHCGISLVHVGNEHRRGGCRRLWQRSCSMTELGLASSQALFAQSNSGMPQEVLRQRCASALALLVTSVVEKGYHPQAAARGDSIQTDVVQAVLRHIRESHGRGCSLENLARIAGYSKYHFLRLFQEHTGRSLRDCVDEARIQAFGQMAATGMPLKVMASKLGFAYPSALCRWQRRHDL